MLPKLVVVGKKSLHALGGNLSPLPCLTFWLTGEISENLHSLLHIHRSLL